MTRIFLPAAVILLSSCPTSFGAPCGDGCPTAYACIDDACVPVAGEGEGEGDVGEGEGDVGEGEGDVGEGEGDVGEGEGDVGEGEGEGEPTAILLGTINVNTTCPTTTNVQIVVGGGAPMVTCAGRDSLPWPANRCRVGDVAVVITNGEVTLPFCTSLDVVTNGQLWDQCSDDSCRIGLTCHAFGGSAFINRYHLPNNNSAIAVCTEPCDESADAAGTCLAGLLAHLPPTLDATLPPTGGMLVPSAWFAVADRCPDKVAVVYDRDTTSVNVDVICDSISPLTGQLSAAPVDDGSATRVANGIPAPNVQTAECGTGSKPAGSPSSRARLCAQAPGALPDNHAACGLGNPAGPAVDQLSCVSRFAREKVAAGMSCTSNRQCESDSCVNGRCGALVGDREPSVVSALCASGAAFGGSCLITAGNNGTPFSPSECASGRFELVAQCAPSDGGEPCGASDHCANSDGFAIVCDPARLICVFPDAPLDSQMSVEGCPGFVDPPTDECAPSSVGGPCIVTDTPQGSCNALLVCLENICR
jgi:hypothetical protein